MSADGADFVSDWVICHARPPLVHPAYKSSGIHTRRVRRATRWRRRAFRGRNICIFGLGATNGSLLDRRNGSPRLEESLLGISKVSGDIAAVFGEYFVSS